MQQKKKFRSIPLKEIQEPKENSNNVFFLKSLKNSKSKSIPSETVQQFEIKDLTTEHSKSKKSKQVFPQSLKQFKSLPYMPFFGNRQEIKEYQANKSAYKAAYEKQIKIENEDNLEEMEEDLLRRKNNDKRKTINDFRSSQILNP